MYEYKQFLSSFSERDSVLEEINNLATEGWELFSPSAYGSMGSSGFVYNLRREIPDPANQLKENKSTENTEINETNQPMAQECFTDPNIRISAPAMKQLIELSTFDGRLNYKMLSNRVRYVFFKSLERKLDENVTPVLNEVFNLTDGYVALLKNENQSLSKYYRNANYPEEFFLKDQKESSPWRIPINDLL